MSINPKHTPANISDLNRDHYSQPPVEWIAGVSDLGLRHSHNQDALSLAGLNTSDIHQAKAGVLVVSDGVSATPGSEVASIVATQTVSATIVPALDANPKLSSAELAELITQAFDNANQAVLDADPGQLPEPGSCTLITAVVLDRTVVVGNVGDSRCYWFGDDGNNLALSIDDSVAQAYIDLGASRAQAETGLNAHAITKWLGAMSQDWSPRITTFTPSVSGWLLVCSDGLWNYASEADDLAQVLAQGLSVAGENPLNIASWLTTWAKEQGGRDNITVALARLT